MSEIRIQSPGFRYINIGERPISSDEQLVVEPIFSPERWEPINLTTVCLDDDGLYQGGNRGLRRKLEVSDG